MMAARATDHSHNYASATDAELNPASREQSKIPPPRAPILWRPRSQYSPDIEQF
jgi:hypothetical protein